MFEPRLSPATFKRDAPPRRRDTPGGKLGELQDPRDVATFAEWDHAAVPDANASPQRLGMPPFTP